MSVADTRAQLAVRVDTANRTIAQLASSVCLAPLFLFFLSGGGGTQTRTVQCFDQANDPNFLTPLADALCTDTKPVSIALCNTQVCPSTVTLVWYTSAWSACSADCKSGGGVTTRTVTCVNQYDEARVNQGDAACAASTTAGTKPASSQACNNQGCSTYELLAGDWGSCSVQCGHNTKPHTQNQRS